MIWINVWRGVVKSCDLIYRFVIYYAKSKEIFKNVLTVQTLLLQICESEKVLIDWKSDGTYELNTLYMRFLTSFCYAVKRPKVDELQKNVIVLTDYFMVWST